jgi:MFS family permease
MTTLRMFKENPSARSFFGAHALSALGTGAAYVALLVLAYDRTHSAWIVSAVLAAELVPAIAFGPLFGALSDRHSPRACVVVADAIRCIAFAGLALAHGAFEIVALATLAGVGTALFNPALLAGIPRLFAEDEIDRAQSFYAAVMEAGRTVGPALAAGALAFTSPAALMATNALSFAASASLLGRLPFVASDPSTPPTERERLLRSVRAGIAFALRQPAVRRVVIAATAMGLVAGSVNVGELLLARDALHAGPSTFSLLVAVFGATSVSAALWAGRATVTRHAAAYGFGLGVGAAGLAGSAFSPSTGFAVVSFALTGWGSGLLIVAGRTLIMRNAERAMLGRIFGTLDLLTASTFGLSLLLAAPLAAALGPRGLFGLAAAVGGLITVWWLADVARTGIANETKGAVMPFARW